jgi:hypothetical protein
VSFYWALIVSDPGTFVLILGMHRSGTSCLAGALEQCGLFLGSVRRTGIHNRKGYFELAALSRIHEEILATNGGSWDAPPARVCVSPRHLHALGRVADFYAHHRPCGLKDPRLLVLLDAWLPLMPQPRTLVGTFRHPLAVARSLWARNRLPEAVAIDLWNRHNSELVSQHRLRPFPLVEYDSNTPESYCQTVSVLAESIGLAPLLPRIREFVDASLDHQRSQGRMPIPASCRETYEYLRDQCARPPQSTACARSTQPPASRSYQLNLTLAPMRALLQLGRRITGVGAKTWRTSSDTLERRGHRRRGRKLDAGQLRRLVIFVGNARSGTTLVRTLLDLHPQVVMANEVNLLRRLSEHEDWHSVLGRISRSAEAFRRKPRWEGYDYRTVAAPSVSGGLPITVIGDKKAGATTRLLMEDILLLERLIVWSPVQVNFIHCVRNPLDVITTKALRNGQSLSWNIERYFEIEQTAAYLREHLGPSRVQSVYHEELIDTPRRTLTKLLQSLSLPTLEEHLSSCESLMSPRPRRTRQLLSWSAAELQEAHRRTERCRHLWLYQAQETSVC